MTCDDFIKTLTNFTYLKNKKKLLIKLFQVAGSCATISVGTAGTWISGTRNCKIDSYFPTGKINEKDIIEFLQTSIATPWSELQKAFSKFEDKHKIDTTTQIETEFFWSIVNQFQELFNLPKTSYPEELNEKPEKCNAQIKRMKKIFYDEYQQCYIKDFLGISAGIPDDRDYIHYVNFFITSINRQIVDAFPDNELDLYAKNKKRDIIEYITTLNIYTDAFLKYDLEKVIESSIEKIDVIWQQYQDRHKKSETTAAKKQLPTENVVDKVLTDLMPTVSIELYQKQYWEDTFSKYLPPLNSDRPRMKPVNKLYDSYRKLTKLYDSIMD